MKLVKALGALALSGIALGAAQLAAAEDTVPVQELVIVEETASPTLADARIPPDDSPYRGDLRPYGLLRPYRPFEPYRPFGRMGTSCRTGRSGPSGRSIPTTRGSVTAGDPRRRRQGAAPCPP
ncbi:hypothetical protein BE20_17600 [Sorangium cellulosum]|nr:hypothetical protein BE20_17600 [Sorangium cellulosum]